MGSNDAVGGIDDIASRRGAPGVGRAKAPTRAPEVTILGRRALAPPVRTRGSAAPNALAIPDRVALYDLHRVYRL